MSKAYLISDIHIGAHISDELKWLNITKNYFNEFLIPILEKNYKKGDKLFILGDLFDNRTHLTIRSICYALDIFDKLEELGIEIHMILGNHDMWGEQSYTFNSMRIFERYKNVFIYKDPNVLEVDDKKILLLPWITNLKEEHKQLKKYAGKVDYLFTHSDLRGAKTNLKVTLKHGPTIADFVGYPKVYAGHIHLYQKIDNFTFLGSPHHLDRNDKGNEKGLTVLDIKSGKEKWIPNKISPEYKTISISKEEDVSKLEDLMNSKEKEDFIDLHINNSLVINKPDVRKKIEKVSKTKKVTIKQINDLEIEDTVEDIELDNIGEDISVEDMIRQYVKNQQYEDNIKNEMETLLEEVIKISKENV